jgi:hypothetical protein
MTLAYYFYDSKDDRRNSATAILRGLILQLLRQRPVLFKHILPDYLCRGEALFDGISAIYTLERILLTMSKDLDAG